MPRAWHALTVASPTDRQLTLNLPLGWGEQTWNAVEASFFAQPLVSSSLRSARMQVVEATASHFSRPEKQMGLGPGRAFGNISSFSFGDDPLRKQALEFNVPVHVSLLSKCHSIVLFPTSSCPGSKLVTSFQCCAKTPKLAFLDETAISRTEPVAKDGDTLAVTESSRRTTVPMKRVRHLNGRKSAKSNLASKASRFETLKLSSSDIDRTRAKLEQLGVEEPALFKYIEQAAPADVSVDQIVSCVSSLMGIARVGWDEAVAMLSKSPSMLKGDSSKVKNTAAFLTELGMNKEEVSEFLVSHPCFFEYDLEEMRLNVDYLVSVGLPKEDFPVILRERPQALNAKADDVKYTIECLLQAEVIPKDLTRVLSKVPDLFSFGTRKNLESRINFFQQVGLYGGALGKGIARRPNLLHFDLECMKQAYNYLSEYLPPSDASKLVRRFAEVLVIDPKRKMEPMVNHLLQLGVKPTKLGKVLLRRPQLLGYTIAGLEPTLQYMKELGVTERMLGRVISIAPQVLTLNCEEKLKPAVEYLRSIGLKDRKDMERLLVRNAQLLCCSIDKNISPKLNFFVNIGLEKEDVIKILVLFPSMFGQSIELSLEPKYRYLVDVMKRSPKEIIDFPQYFGYSLEKRIKPRFEKLAARGITNISLPSMLACVESDFINRYLVGDPPSRAPYNLKKAPRKSKYTD